MAALDFAVQEAQTVLRTLQRERELAQRIEQSIQQLRARTSRLDPGEGARGSGAA